MRIAIPTEGPQGLEDKIEEHFGRARYYTIVEVREDEPVGFEILETPFGTHQPGEIPKWLKAHEVDLVLACGIGERAISFFEEMGIGVIKGVSGKVKEAVQRFLEGTLDLKDWECHRGEDIRD